VTFRPFGRDIVSIEEAERRGLSQQAPVPDQPACLWMQSAPRSMPYTGW
jgi:hypothetical protein